MKEGSGKRLFASFYFGLFYVLMVLGAVVLFDVTIEKGILYFLFVNELSKKVDKAEKEW